MSEHAGRVFDREPFWDPQNARHLVRQTVPLLPLVTKSWRSYVLLDQGNVGHCVAFCNGGEAAARPAVVRGVDDQWAHDLFWKIQEIDRREGRYYDDGATMLAGAKAMRELGYIDSFVWATSVDEIKQALMVGPVLMGTEWRDTMFDVDEHGYLDVSGDAVGGHAWWLRGYAVTKRRYKMRNSWGFWGYRGSGDAYLEEDALADLLAKDGEALLYRGRTSTQTP